MSIVFLLIILFILFLFAVTYNYSFPRKQAILLLVVLVVSLALLGAITEPKSIYDLSRHYDLLNAIKNSTFSLKTYLRNGPDLLNENYQYTFLFNILCYVIARYLPFQVLPFFAIILSYSCFLYVLIDFFGKKELTNRNIFLSIALCQVIMPFLFVYSGIRNALAASIVAVGIYRFFLVNHSYLELAIITVCSVLFHPIGFVIVPFIFVSRITPGIKSIFVPFVLPSIVFLITEYCRLRLGNDFLFRIAAKYYNYTQVRVDNQGRVFFFSSFIVLLMIAGYSIYHFVKKIPVSEDKSQTQLMSFLAWYSMFSIGYFTSYEMLTRLPYNFALLAPVIVSCYCKRNEKRTVYSLASPVIIIGMFILSVYETVMWLV